jgi:endonuclease/exonuclease/phosphatase family metal-dependent hydrolase
MGTPTSELRGARRETVRPRLRFVLSLLLAAALIIAVGAFLHPPGRLGNHQGAAATRSKYVLLQMNLCLSGLAQCFDRVQYPLGVDEARARIGQSHADAVTLNEVCSRDVHRLARATGYHMRFATVRYLGEPLPCRDPGDRGRYGIAVLTRAGISRSTGGAYRVQDDVEQRHWLCVTTDDSVIVCATHLDIRGSATTQEVNDAQCAELSGVLARFEPNAALIAAGDMNRSSSCAADGMWVRTDGDAEQQPGLQQVYGSSRFSSPVATVVPMAYTDHDALVVTSWLSG